MNNNERGPGGSNAVLDVTTCSLAKFAAVVHRAIALIGNGELERFGNRKVFVSAVYAAIAGAGRKVGSLSDFKARLVLAHSAGLLSLVRADLVAAMPTGAVSASEVRFRGAEFHFVIDARARDPWEMAS